MSAERDICRYEFLEFLVRTSFFRHIDQGKLSEPVEAIEKLLEEQVYPNALFNDGEEFRKFYCYNIKVDEILMKNS